VQVHALDLSAERFHEGTDAAEQIAEQLYVSPVLRPQASWEARSRSRRARSHRADRQSPPAGDSALRRQDGPSRARVRAQES
jgi:hypothetical protein